MSDVAVATAIFYLQSVRIRIATLENSCHENICTENVIFFLQHTTSSTQLTFATRAT